MAVRATVPGVRRAGRCQARNLGKRLPRLALNGDADGRAQAIPRAADANLAHEGMLNATGLTEPWATEPTP
eukprot:CAMPEP_0183443232 /NCGR_PEP_ID=MMETSP0370-20130417/91013_1 /TAXON_ID=268820 /ORGANISM="Peridinium aciculiferum, Strain PAER-2" /LENGTH=70 /DNA_ID=CAMNT_0025633141 /DNA_START=86 /DNA_END=298 /DNA_ORIENTATION=-